MKILIGVPARDMINASFAHDLAMMVGWHVRNYPDHDIGVVTKLGTLIVNQRQDLVKEALTQGADYLLFLDADMRFPMNTLERMIAHDKDIVAANYPTRRLPPKPTAFKEHHPTIPLRTTEESTGLEQAVSVGAGVMLIKTAILWTMELPIFNIVWDDYHRNFIGEDVYFCKKAGEAGYTIWVDHDLSKEVMHVGMFDYLNSHVDEVDEQGLRDEYAKIKAERDGDYELRGTEDSGR
jgi:hypothetical protein